MTQCTIRRPQSRFLWLLLVFLHHLFLSKAAFLAANSPKALHVQHEAPRTVLAISTASENDATQTDKEEQTPEQLNQHNYPPLPAAVEFTDPETQCRVVLLGCFHGTESSSKDVEQAVTPDTSVVALELCTTRFADLQREFAKTEEEIQRQKPWLVAYWEMITKTISQRGLPTGLAAAVLGGFSGIQTALSGFTPGLEFITALERAQEYDCDVILADQDVDETLRRVGSLPQVALGTALGNDRLERWGVYQETLIRAVAGQQGDPSGPLLPQVQLPSVLLRNPAAIKDLIRLTVPPTVLWWTVLYGIAAVLGIDVSNSANNAYYETATLVEMIPHWLASAGVLAMGYLGLALPAVGVILTERDEILTSGIQAACRRAGNGGRVVAVVGLLHVNGIAKRMLTEGSSSDTDEKQNR
jgi:hypothetical protein